MGTFLRTYMSSENHYGRKRQFCPKDRFSSNQFARVSYGGSSEGFSKFQLYHSRAKLELVQQNWWQFYREKRNSYDEE